MDHIHYVNSSRALFKARAYKRAADVIANLPLYIEDIYEKDGIKGQIDAHYDRLDLKDDYVRQYKRMSNL
jgi:hypothetical protein